MVIPRMSRNGLVKRLGEFGAAAGGAVAIYVAFAGVALMGALVLALDVGRLAVVRSQMQNAADAACLSAAVQLDGRSGATTRAEAVARSATLPTSDYNVTSGGAAITIGTLTNGIVFYSDSTLTTTTTVDGTRPTVFSRPHCLTRNDSPCKLFQPSSLPSCWVLSTWARRSGTGVTPRATQTMNRGTGECPNARRNLAKRSTVKHANFRTARPSRPGRPYRCER